MAATHNVACTLTVKADTGSGLAILGYTIEGGSYSVRAFQTPIHSDEGGGPDGPPVDIMLKGVIHTWTLELIKYDSAMMSVIETYKQSGTPGSSTAPCTLLFADSKYFRLLLTGTNFTRNYVRAIPTDVSIGPIGSTVTRARVTFDCYAEPTAGVIHNTTIV